MKHKMRSRELTMEIVVGTFLFMVLLALSIFTIILSRENIFRKSYASEVVFKDVMGLREGDNVVIRGMPVGKVKTLMLASDGVHVLFETDRKLVFRKDYKIQVISTSILGGRYLQVHEGLEGEELPDGIRLTGVTPSDIMVEATELVAKARRTIEDSHIFENAGAAVSNLNAIIERIARGEGTLGKIIKDEALYADIAETMREIKLTITERKLLDRISAAAENLEAIAAKINAGEGTLGRLVNDPALYDDVAEVAAELQKAVKERGLLEKIEASVANLEEISGKIARGEGTLGKITTDETLYNQLKQAMNDVSAVLNDLRETTPITTFSSIMFGAF